jgi:membrane dipeptidase
LSLIIDGHEDLAYNMLAYKRDYRRSALETRRLEKGTEVPGRNGEALLGWPEYQSGQIALIISSLFIVPEQFRGGAWDWQLYRTTDQAYRLYHQQINTYYELYERSPEAYRIVYSRQDLADVLRPWQQSPASYPQTTHPVGLVITIEGAEGILNPAEMEEWWSAGVRMVGPVWAGNRFCGGTYVPGGFTKEGYELLDVMQDLGFTLDIAHMTETSARQALDRYEGPVVASHANVRSVLKNSQNERLLSDQVIARLVERDGIIGVMGYNRFLLPGWAPGDDRHLVSLSLVVDHIDHICQIAGDSRHVGIGTDFEGSFGLADVPLEIETVADLQKIAQFLESRGYSGEDVDSIMYGNWRRHLERTLPDR